MRGKYELGRKTENMTFKKYFKESITIDIKVGDTILGGRFKNHPVVVKEIGKNEKGDITINGHPLLKFRIPITEAVMFHVTPTKNVKSIMSSGLIPKIGKSSKKMEKETGIYLFPSREDAEDALMNWLGDEFGENEKLSLLSVDTKGLNVQKQAFEFNTKDKIDPKRIKVVTNEL